MDSYEKTNYCPGFWTVGGVISRFPFASPAPTVHLRMYIILSFLDHPGSRLCRKKPLLVASSKFAVGNLLTELLIGLKVIS